MNTSEKEEDHQHQNPPQTIQSHPILSRLKPLAYWVSAVLVILLALSLSFPNNQYYKLQYLKSPLSFNPLNPNVLYRLLRFIESTQQTKQPLSTKPNFNEPPHCVLWMAPFLSGGGYSSEAWSYITVLNQYKRAHRFRLGIEQHGNLVSFQFWEGLPKEIKDLTLVLHNTACRMNETIVVCHSESGAWYLPLFDTLPCPPADYEEPMYVIGRAMFETEPWSC